VKARCEAVRELLQKWGYQTAESNNTRAQRLEHDWRRWNLGAANARAVVRANERALRDVTCWDENGESPFGAREWRKPIPGEQWYVEPRT
jgi:hypothetical protein